MESNEALRQWNLLEPPEALAAVLPCCGAPAWADAMTHRRPFASVEGLLETASIVWRQLSPAQQETAFQSHPRIGERHVPGANAVSLAWSAAEQAKALATAEHANALARANAQYEQKFGRIFLTCASSRGSQEILAELERRLHRTADEEFDEAVLQQQQITALRLRRWLGEESLSASQLTF